ncbi:MAG: alpha-galactosidase [Spirochaetales bacterium]|nr:alpha-galactosidase [Spirochaetales bacterium]
MIQIENNGSVFHLKAGGSSYVITVFAERYLIHGYWGEAIQHADPHQLLTLGARPYTVTEPLSAETATAFQKQWVSSGKVLTDRPQQEPELSYSPERLPLEYPVAGMGDLREAALRIRFADGSTTGALEYQKYELLDRTPGPEGLPYITDLPEESETLRIDMVDKVSGVNVSLYYLPINHLSIILRWARISNDSNEIMEIDQAASASMDLPRFEADMLSLNGSWAKERHFHRRPVSPGVQLVESRGGASSHQHSPFIALAERDVTEQWGTIRAVSILYSGNHRHLAEQDQYGAIRIQCGINPNGFRYKLSPGESFDTPAAALAFSNSGISGISDAYHGFVRTCLLPTQWRDRDRPILVNTWEAQYFDVNVENVIALAKEGKKIGGEVLVLDDGWFVNRSDDKRALGDWIPDPKKFPGGLLETVNRVRELGMEFGLWVEPEMVNPESKLFQRHPDWILSAPGRTPVMARNQLVLNLGKEEVVDYLLDVFSGIFSSAPISYVKWDMNRYMIETGSPEDPHRYMLGLYRLWSTLVQWFPTILFEGCAGGGGRFDFGSLAFMPQFWTSDQTDALERQGIQFGTSLLFPPETMGAHVSAVPNHQVGRITPAETRGLTALCFNFGYELDLLKESEADKATYSRLSALYKQYRPLFRTGRFIRLLPEQHHFSDLSSGRARHNSYAWAIISQNKKKAMVFFFQALADANDDGRWLKIVGLEEEASYRDIEKKTTFESAFLASRGLWIPPARGDYRSTYWILEKE